MVQQSAVHEGCADGQHRSRREREIQRAVVKITEMAVPDDHGDHHWNHRNHRPGDGSEPKNKSTWDINVIVRRNKTVEYDEDTYIYI